MAKPIELLAINSGSRPDTQEPVLILTVREDPNSFHVTEFFFSFEQASRMYALMQNIMPSLRSKVKKDLDQMGNPTIRAIIERQQKDKKNGQ